jgi:transcriptional regulator with XRE-family HTH domain
MKPEHVQVAATLRRMREEASVTRDEAALVLGCTRSKIGDLETGRSKPKPAELERLLDHYGIIGTERDEMVEFARSSRTRRKPSPYTAAVIPATVRRAIDLEAQAVSTVWFSPELIPGLLQIPDYARALINFAWESQPEEFARRLELRMERASVLTRTHRPPLHYWCILGEAALRTNIGGPKVMRAQIEHLVRLNRTLSNLVIQVLPLGSGPHAFIGVTLTLHRFPPPAPDMMIFEGYGREMIRDDPSEVSRATHHLDLVRAKALGLQDSTEFMERLHHELAGSG